MHFHERVEGRERIVVLHIDARLAGAAGTFPDDIPVEIPFTDCSRSAMNAETPASVTSRSVTQSSKCAIKSGFVTTGNSRD
jgi:hypothetical protein